MRITVSGTTYEAAIRNSDVPTEEHWPAPRRIRRGSGHQYVYDNLTNDEYQLIASHLRQMYGSAIAWGTMPEDIRDRTALARDIARLH